MPYIVEYARSGRSKCKGPKSCVDKVIPKGALRLGSVTERSGMEQTFWRHWKCVTPKILESIDEVENLDGFVELLFEDKQMVEEAVRTRALPKDGDNDQELEEDQDIQNSKTKKPLKKDEDSTIKKRTRKPKAEISADDEAPKKRGRKTKVVASDADSEEELAQSKKPKSRKPKSAPPKGRARKAVIPSNSGSESE